MTPEEQAEPDRIAKCRQHGQIVCPEEYDFLMPRVFPQLTIEENELIEQAREAGFRAFFSSRPSLEQQARSYLEAARGFLAKIGDRSESILDDRTQS